MAKYQIRINIIKKDEVGEGEFFWYDDQTLPQPCPDDSHFGINYRHWSTVAFEIIPCQILPQLSNKKEWKVTYGFDSELVMARYESSDGDVAICELCDKDGFVSCHWAKEDIPAKGSRFTVFPGNGKEVPCETAQEVAHSIVDAIMDAHNRRGYIRARK